MFLQRLFDRILAWKPVPKAAKNSRREPSRSDTRSREEVLRDGVPPVPRREIFIALGAGLNLVILPWCYGGADLWGQRMALGLSLVTFAFLFVPVGYDEWRSKSAAESFRAVVRCVPFWCGFLLIGYMLVQAANPRYEVIFDGQVWIPMPVDGCVRWLPHGVDAPAWIQPGPTSPGGMNAYREAMVFAPMWLTFTALWCGVRSRRVIVWLVRGVVASVVALAVFAMGMRISGETMLYGRIPVSSGSWYGPFGYQNQGGAYFTMAFLLAVAIALRQWRIGTNRVSKGGEHLLLWASAILLAGAAIYSLSFGSVAAVGVSILALVPVAWLAVRGAPRDTAISLPGLFVAATLIVSLVLCVAFLSDLEPLWHKVLYKFDLMKTSGLDDRSPIRAATWLMFDDPNVVRLFGVGAGSYRWMSPEYFSRFPEFMSPSGVLSRASYAHCDWLQMLVEWGYLGVVPVVVSIAWFARRLVAFEFWKSAIVLPLVIACAILFCHAFIDFLLFSPSLNLLAAFVAFVALAWAREASSRKSARG